MINHENTAHFERLDMIPNKFQKCKHFFTYFMFFLKSIDIIAADRYNDPIFFEK